jgi:type I restriction enzyme, S subunit
LPPKTIVFAKIGEALRLNRRAMLTKPSLVDNNVAGVKAHSLIDDHFLYYFFLTVNLENYSRATAVPSVRKSDIEKIPFYLPPLNEQKRIVAKIEALFAELEAGVASLKTAQAQLKTYRQALLKHAFTGKLTEQWRAENAENADNLEDAHTLLQRIRAERQARHAAALTAWAANGKPGQKPRPPKDLPPLTPAELEELPQLPAGWVWVKVGDISDIGTGVTPLKSRRDFYNGGTVPWVTSGSVNKMFVTKPSSYVTETALNETNLTLYPKHTLLVALYGEGKTRGKCSELLIEATTNQAIAAIVQEGTSAKIRRYLKWYFQKHYEDLRLKSSGGVQPNLNLSIIANTVFPMCSIQESERLVEMIESKVSVIDQLEQTITTALQQAEALRQSILKQAFSGQLVAQDPADEPAGVLLARIRAMKEATP